MIELIMVVVIVGILATVAAQKFGSLADTVLVEETMREMDEIAIAITGDPSLENNGIRSDFGYIGDVGSLPPDLDALVTNPGSYTTWNGPYLNNSFEQISTDYKTDAWQTVYTYGGSVTVSSTGSGETINRRLAQSSADLLYNRVRGNIFDFDGTPPGNIYRDSITVRMTIPNGTGGTAVRAAIPDIGGYYSLDSIPIGNHTIEIVYVPQDDTLRQLVSVEPGASTYSEHRLTGDVWRGLNLNSGLVGHWPLNESSGVTASDASGNGNDGSLTNMTGAEWTTGKIAGGLSFDGVDDEVIIPDNDILDGMSQMSLSYWIYPTIVDGNPRGPVSKRVHWTTEYSYSTFLYSGNRLNVDIAGSNNRFSCPTVFQANQWYHIAVVFDGSLPEDDRVTVYIDGTPEQTARESSTAVPNTASNLIIGHLFGNSSGFFAGTVDDVRLYSIALTEQEILALYQAGS